MAGVMTAAVKLRHFRLGTETILDPLHSRQCTKHSG